MAARKTQIMISIENPALFIFIRKKPIPLYYIFYFGNWIYTYLYN